MTMTLAATNSAQAVSEHDVPLTRYSTQSLLLSAGSNAMVHAYVVSPAKSRPGGVAKAQPRRLSGAGAGFGGLTETTA